MPRGGQSAFCGRTALIAEILDGPRDCVWLLGSRGIGKTSLLRQVALRAEGAPERGDLPLLWDLGRAESVAELGLAFRAGLSEAAAHLERVGLRPADLEDEDVLASIRRTRRELRSRRLRLLLLCDDGDGLTRLREHDPALLRKLRRTLQPGEEVRTVIASTVRLWALAEQKEDTTSFLHGFTPPVYLQGLSKDEARSLVRQDQLPAGARGAIGNEAVERIVEASGGHPHLLQWLGARVRDRSGVEEALREATTDSGISKLFSSDLDSLSEAERAVLGVLADEEAMDLEQLRTRAHLGAGAFRTCLFRLESLGLLRRDQRSRLTLGSSVFQRWLTARPRSAPRPSSGARATDILADLSRVEGPVASTRDDLFKAVYAPLRQLAARYLRRERRGHTLQPTALVHEAYLRLVDQSRVDWRGRTHFFAVGAKIMRRILIDHARSRRRAKRGGGWLRITLSGLSGPPLAGDFDPVQLLAFHSALEELARLDARQAKVVELRCFAGLGMSEVARVLGISKRTADADWAKARVWLERVLSH